MVRTYNCIIAPVLLVSILCSYSCNDRNDKTLALRQSHISLEKGYEAYEISEKINQILVRVKVKKWTEQDINNIDSLSQNFVQKLRSDIEYINQEKASYRETSLFDSTVEYLRAVEKLEEIIPQFVRYVTDTTAAGEDLELNTTLRNRALAVQRSGMDWKNARNEFYAQSGITQNEIDSIENLIRN